ARDMPISQVTFVERYASNSSLCTDADSSAVALAVNSGWSNPRSPANAQHAQSNGIVTLFESARAIRSKLALDPRTVLEHVGCKSAESSFFVIFKFGSKCSAAKSIASMMRRLEPALSFTASTKPSEQEEFSHTTGSRPLSLAISRAAYVVSTIFAYPEVIPFEAQGVPQHRFAIPSGIVEERPAFRAKDFSESAE